MPALLDDAFARKEWTTPVPEKTATLFPDPHIPGIPDPFAAVRDMLQKSRLNLVVHVIAAKVSPVDKMTVFASLENSTISSGAMNWDEDWKRGYFQDKIVVEMWLENADGTPRTDLRRTADGPQTVNGSGSTSSSVSLSFSGSANVGFFGGTPTGGAGGSVGGSQTQSFTRNLQDFKVINESDQFRAKHTYRMQQSSGAAYDKATDLVPSGDAIGFVDAFRAIKLYTPPDLATSNLELLSQCVWQASDAKMIHDDVILRISVTQRVVVVNGQNNFFTVASGSSGLEIIHSHAEPLPLASMSPPADNSGARPLPLD